MRGIVYKSTGTWYTVKTEEGVFYDCRIKGKFRIQGIKSTNPVAVGDHVIFELEDTGDQQIGVITEIEDRQNYIIRKSVKLSKQTHIIAANIDLLFLLVTLKNPKTYTIFIDRFLATSEAYDIPAVLLFNKIDLYDEQETSELNELVALYQAVGYTCLKISAKDGTGSEEVIEMMKGKTNMFAGNSGVGKSTLVNLISPDSNIKTKEISELHLQGQHTTTFAEMYDLDFNARIIDTPGIKGFGVVDMEPDEIGDYFPELFRLKADCKFNNCLHLDEPKCAVKQALEEGEISESRYKSYVQMVSGLDKDSPQRIETYFE